LFKNLLLIICGCATLMRLCYAALEFPAEIRHSTDNY
jgi:hypothetical protein